MVEERDLHAAVEAEFGAPLLLAPYASGAAGFARKRPARHPRNAIRDWLEELLERGRSGETLVCLVPARTDTSWWWNFCRFGHVRFLKSRVRFEGEKSGAPFPSAVVVFGPGARTDLAGWWNITTGELHLLPVGAQRR